MNDNEEILKSYDVIVPNYINSVPGGSVGTFVIPVLWMKLLEEGATALISALGEKVGAGLGEAILNALLGKTRDDTAFQTEVIQRLARIEGKIDELVIFIKAELPEILRGVVRDELIVSVNHALASSRTQMKGAVAQLDPHKLPTDREVKLLEDAAIAAGRNGQDLLMYDNPAIYLAGAHALTIMVAGYSRAARTYRGSIKGLAAWAEAYSPLVAPWIDPNNPVSLKSILTRLENELRAAQPIVATLPITMLNLVFSPVYVSNLDKHVSWGVWNKFSLNPAGELIAEYKGLVDPLWIEPALPIPTDIYEFTRRFPVTIAPWYIPEIFGDGGRQLTRDYTNYYNDAFAIADKACRTLKTHPARIEVLKNAIVSIENIATACEKFRGLA